MSQRVVFFNGEFIPESEARVSIFDSAMMFGDMAFEAARTFRHEPFRLRSHLDRLYRSLRLIEIDCGHSLEELEQLTLDTLHRNLPTESADVDWFIMHNISRGPLPIYETAFPSGLCPTVVINCWPLIMHMGPLAAKYDHGVDLMIPAQLAIPAHLMDPKAKNRSRLYYQMANLQASRVSKSHWPVLVDPDGYLAEGPGWNIFLVKDGVLYSPEPRNILRGVSRQATIDLARELGIPFREANLVRYDALDADEIFCSSTTYSIVHAATFEGQNIGDGNPGPIFTRLIEAWKQHVGLDFVAQAHAYADRLVKWQSQDLEPHYQHT